MPCRFIYDNKITADTMLTASSIASGLVSSAVKDGTGSAVITTTGTYTAGSDREYVVEIDSVAGGAEIGQATFKWSNDGGATWEATGVTTDDTNITLEDGVQIYWTAGSGSDFVLADRWYFKAVAPFGLSKLLDRDRDTRCRSGSLDNPNTITINLGSALACSALVIYDHNLTSAATITLKAKDPNLYIWIARNLPSVALWSAIAWNGTVFCAVDGNSNKAATSPDGITWTARTLPSSATWMAIAWNGTVFCAVALGSNKAATSPDGITWTARTLPSSDGNRAIAWNGTIFCAVAFGNQAATSPDGITWTARTLPSGANWMAIAWNGTVFCAVALGSNKAATSPDGITWTARTLPSSANWSAIAWNGTVFCAVASGSNKATTSPDGITWTNQTLPSSAGWNAIAWNGTVFCAVAGITSATSPDGITWTNQTMPYFESWVAIAWNGTVFCAVSGTGAATSAEYSYSASVTYSVDKIIHYFAATKTLKEWRLEITDASNPSGYIEIGNLMLGPYLELTGYFAWGSEHGRDLLLDADRNAYGIGKTRFYNDSEAMSYEFKRLYDADIAALRTMLASLIDLETGILLPLVFTPDTTLPNSSYLIEMTEMKYKREFTDHNTMTFVPREVLTSVTD